MNHIPQRLTSLEIIQRAEAHEHAWAQWAVFWLSLGAILGCAATLLAIAIWGR
jgi:hypothetical protein